MKQFFYLGISNNYRTNIIVLPSFQLATQFTSQNTNETEFINEHLHINLFINIGISNWHNYSFDLYVNVVFDFISFPYTITALQAPETL
jgi:hypothetical protein